MPVKKPAAPRARKATARRSTSSAAAVLPTEEEIRLRAYEIFLARGCQPGQAIQDWLQAERELTEAGSER